MGRRSINTTKSGKYMNPTDQARKEARKRELKKNKKQRMAVRAAVLKNKDPVGLLQDLEALDELEFNPEVKTDLNEKVIKDKRKKIRETFERVLKLYSREEPERYGDYKKAEKKYNKQREAKIKEYGAIRDAKLVTVESIPLPDAPDALSAIPLPQDIPLPGAQPPSILKKSSSYGPPLMMPPFMTNLQPAPPPLTWPYCLPNGKKPPGPPPGLPPGVAVPPPGPPSGLPPHLLAAHEMEQILRAEREGEGVPSSDEEEEEDMEEEIRARERENESDEMETDDSDSEAEREREQRLAEGSDDSDTEDSMADEQEKEERRERRRQRRREEDRRRRGSDDDDDDGYSRRRRRRGSNSDEDDEAHLSREKRSVRFADDDGESEGNLSRRLPPGMTPLQARMLAMAGQQIPDTPVGEVDDEEEEEEMEDNRRSTRDEKDDHEEEEREADDEDEKDEDRIDDAHLNAIRQAAAAAAVVKAAALQGLLPPPTSTPGGTQVPAPPARPPPGPPPTAPPGFPPGIPLPGGVPPGFTRPPPLRPPPPPLRMVPPGPPAGRPPVPPPGPPPGVPPLLRGGPPPRLPIPPNILPPPRLPMPLPRMGMPRLENPNVFTAAPMIRRLPTKAEELAEVKSSATIEAKPQIRNLTADVTRFMPTSLRVKRDAKGKTKGMKAGGLEETAVAPAMKPNPAVQSATKDDAYDQFMKEMGDLM